MTYNITNYAGWEGNENYAEQTFVVDGYITLENFNCNNVIITADAIDQMGYSTNIFTMITINGDGKYYFKMDSYYKTGGGRIVSIKNIEVKNGDIK